MAEDWHDDDKNAQNAQGHEPKPFAEEEAGDPAAAFEALRTTMENLAADLTREMTTIRKGVEYTLDQMEQRGAPVDYSAELGRLTQSQVAMSERLQGIEQSPTLKHGPEHFARVIERGGESLVRTAAQQLERTASDLERISSAFASHNKNAFLRKDQDFRMWMAVGVGLIVGAFLMLLLPRFLPFSADSHVAALVMGRDRISAGYAMIRAADPFETGKMEWGRKFYESNSDPISVCLQTAKQTGRDQKCTITVPAPEK
ncbi:hypothetical protein C8J35_1283 [Rhizobium sp. PP-F2F-G38]|nr:hypothetical protein C8J37_1342 [Rhizobium sp. PP-WC-1G-195]PYE92114.1 hypothetical protein C8J35_1283 [Rhizobium sp. PP-F2F-G38]